METPDYKYLYHKYKTKYINLKNQIGAGKKKTCAPSSAASSASTPASDELVGLFADISTLVSSSNSKQFLKKYSKKFDSLSNSILSRVIPLQHYINLGGKSTEMMDFLSPCDTNLLFNLDEDGQTLFHRLVINNDADSLEYLFFISFGDSDNAEHEEIRNKIVNTRNRNTYKLSELASRLDAGGTHTDVIKLLRIISSPGSFSTKQEQYLTRQRQKSMEIESGLMCYGSSKKQIIADASVCAAGVEPTPIGKRKVNQSVQKNNDDLQRKLRDPTDKYHFCFTLDNIAKWVRSGHIHYIDNLYVKKTDGVDIETILSTIPADWNVGNIRMITNNSLSDSSITMIAEMSYDFMNQADDSEEASEA